MFYITDISSITEFTLKVSALTDGKLLRNLQKYLTYSCDNGTEICCFHVNVCSFFISSSVTFCFANQIFSIFFGLIQVVGIDVFPKQTEKLCKSRFIR